MWKVLEVLSDQNQNLTDQSYLQSFTTPLILNDCIWVCPVAPNLWKVSATRMEDKSFSWCYKRERSRELLTASSHLRHENDNKARRRLFVCLFVGRQETAASWGRWGGRCNWLWFWQCDRNLEVRRQHTLLQMLPDHSPFRPSLWCLKSSFSISFSSSS